MFVLSILVVIYIMGLEYKMNEKIKVGEIKVYMKGKHELDYILTDKISKVLHEKMIESDKEFDKLNNKANKMKFKKIEDEVPSNDRNVLVKLKSGNDFGVAFYAHNCFHPANVDCDHYGLGSIDFDSSVIAWAELPEVVYE